MRGPPPRPAPCGAPPGPSRLERRGLEHWTASPEALVLLTPVSSLEKSKTAEVLNSQGCLRVQ